MRRPRSVQCGALALLTVLAVGCSDESSTAGPTSNDPLVAKIISLGFRRDMIADRGDHFVVEGDIRMAKRDIAELVDQNRGLRPDFQYRTTNLVGQTQVQTINVSLGLIASQPAWVTAVRQAIPEWNRVNCSNVRFVEGGSPTHITFRFYSGDLNTVALGDSPLNTGLPGASVFINTRVAPRSALVNKRNVAHELGHTIGFRHTNWKSLDDPQFPLGAIQISGTPTTDGASVMNGATAGSAWNGFSFFDRIATRNLYPNFNPSVCVSANLTGPSQIGPYFFCTWTASPTGGTPPYLYAWNGGPFGTGSIYKTSAQGRTGFTIGVAVLDAVGRRAEHSIGVSVNPYSSSC